MAIDIQSQSLLPVRRDKQIPSSTGTISVGGGIGGGGTDSSIDLTGVLKESSLGSHFKWVSGYLNVSDYISKTQVDASLNNTFNLQSYIDGSVALLASNKGAFVQCSSIGASSAHTVYWNSGYLEASTGTGTGDVTKIYVDGSLALRDASLNNVFAIQSYTNSSTYIDGSLNVKANIDASISYKTAAYTLTSIDDNRILEASGTFSIYLPTNLNTGFQTLIVNVGGGTITLSASTGATYLARDSSNDLTKRYSGATVYKRDSTQWVAMGDLN
jgi:hypothetical protein